MAKTKGKWEIFYVRYLNPIFGTEGREFSKDVHMFLVSTQGGIEDARAACERYHSGSKIISIVDKLSEAAGLGMVEVNKYFDKLAKK